MTQINKNITDNQTEYLHEDITSKIIAGFYKVYNTLGYGFLEKVYENSLYIELKKWVCLLKSKNPLTFFMNLS